MSAGLFGCMYIGTFRSDARSQSTENRSSSRYAPFVIPFTNAPEKPKSRVVLSSSSAAALGSCMARCANPP